MSTWEERMSARAQERIRAEQERERARQEAEWAREAAEEEERYRPVREAGPPGGCHECWHWAQHGPAEPHWYHGDSVQPGPPPDDLDPGFYSGWREPLDTDWCWHPCHGDEAPRCCIPVGYAAAS